MNEDNYSPNGCLLNKHYSPNDDDWKVTDGRRVCRRVQARECRRGAGVMLQCLLSPPPSVVSLLYMLSSRCPSPPFPFPHHIACSLSVPFALYPLFLPPPPSFPPPPMRPALVPILSADVASLITCCGSGAGWALVGGGAGICRGAK